jgi:hypothetical protein
MDHRCSCPPNDNATPDITTSGMGSVDASFRPSSYSFSCVTFQWQHGCQGHLPVAPERVSEPRKPDAIEPMAWNPTRTVSTSDPRNRQATKPRAASLFSKIATHDNVRNRILDKWA